MAASQFAADTPLLVMGLIAVGGVASLWRLWIYGLAFLFMGFVLGAAWRRAGVLTDAELTMVRYAARGATAVRALKALYYGTVINCTVMAFVMIAATRIFEVFLPWHEWLPGRPTRCCAAGSRMAASRCIRALAGLDAATATTNSLLGILAIVAFVALYSTTGGLRSVVRHRHPAARVHAGRHARLRDLRGGRGRRAGRARRAAGRAVRRRAGAERYTSFVPAAEALAPF
jgi:solute:Na+ symporter, SSS family